MKKTLAILCALAMVFALCACGETAAPAAAPAASPEAVSDAAPAASDAKTFTVGVCQLVQHPALDAATQGFQDALTEKLGDQVSFSVQNASGDSATCSVICNQFVSDGVDLILANATPALLAAQSATSKIPILGTSVTDYADALGLEAGSTTTGTNISGTSDGVPAQSFADLLKQVFPDTQKVGMLYCSGEPNSKFQADQIRPILEGMGYTVADYTFADSNDVAQVAANACDDSDVLYIPTDNTAASNAELINSVCLEKKVPVVAGEENLCLGCGSVTLSISYYDLGKVTGEMAAKVLADGADVSTMTIEYAPFTGKYNAANCEALSVAVPEGFEAIEG
ncbi:MAG: ABC transporter substrate-binding protein [Oscillospiraceae bacterium]|nr:ABC transporter substrate-binding protein [Oscillospiraceae bacterium]